MDIILYHNPSCGTSRTTLAIIRDAGIEPRVIEYLKNPPTRAELETLISAIGTGARAILRDKAAPYSELGLADPKFTDAELIEALLAHPILLNRPIVVSPMGTKVCRPAETVLTLLPPQSPNVN